jgi:hypothetical protein
MGLMFLQKIFTNVRSSKRGIGISINKSRVIGLILLFIIIPFFFVQLFE